MAREGNPDNYKGNVMNSRHSDSYMGGRGSRKSSGKSGPFASVGRMLGRTRRLHGRGSLLTFMVVLGMIALLVGVLWYSYPRGNGEITDGQTVPLIRADNEPFRVKPEDRGGMDVPYRDSTIFQTMRDGKLHDGEHVENLLGDNNGKVKDISERPALFAGLNTETKPAPASNNNVKNLLDDDEGGIEAKISRDLTEKPIVVARKAEPEKEAKDVSAETRALVHSVLKEHEEAERLSKVEPAAGAAVPAAAPDRNSFVQLVSLKSRDSADSAWPGLQKRYSVLSNTSYRVQKADLGSRGQFFRVQAGPYSKAEAERICGKIKSVNPGGCLVVGR